MRLHLHKNAKWTQQGFSLTPPCCYRDLPYFSSCCGAVVCMCFYLFGLLPRKTATVGIARCTLLTCHCRTGEGRDAAGFLEELGAGYLLQTLADGTCRRLERTRRAVYWTRRPNADMFIADTYVAPVQEGRVSPCVNFRLVHNGHAASLNSFHYLLNSVHYWRCVQWTQPRNSVQVG